MLRICLMKTLPGIPDSGERGDAVIVCGTTVDQVKANVDACADDTPLPQVGRGFS